MSPSSPQPTMLEELPRMTDEEAKAEAIKTLEYALQEAKQGNLWQIVVLGHSGDRTATTVLFSPYQNILTQIGLLDYAKSLATGAVDSHVPGGPEEAKPN